MSKKADVVLEQISQCEELLIENNRSNINKFVLELYHTYKFTIKSISNIARHKSYIELDYDDLKICKNSLELYRGELLDSIKLEELKQQKISLSASVNDSGNSNNTNTNTNTNTVDVKTLFEDAKKEIKNNGFLTEEEIEEIIKKINEIEQISDEEISRPRKWGKLKSVINWMTTKGVDIGTKICPLIMASLENNN